MSGKRWTERDRLSNEVYLTEERWEHITSPINHPEMADYEEELKQTVQSGQRKQDDLNPRKYRYSKRFGNLVEDNTHIEAVTIFGFSQNEEDQLVPNNYIVTAYQKEILSTND